MLLQIFVLSQALFFVAVKSNLSSSNRTVHVRYSPYCQIGTRDIFGQPDNTLHCFYALQNNITIPQFLQNLPNIPKSPPWYEDNRTWTELAPSLQSLIFTSGYGDHVFEQNFFDSLPKLKMFSVGANTSLVPPVCRLKLPPGAFENNPKLRELHIYDFILEEETFQAIRSVKDRVNELRLGDNEPARRLLDVVAEFTNLTLADLRSNIVVTQISLPNIFAKSASTMAYIFLNGFYIPKITKKSFEGMPNLLNLQLMACNITSIDADAFENLTNLKWLDLQYNDKLETLPAGVFDKLTKLKLVRLHKRGEIGNLTRNNFTHVENFDQFVLEMDNPFIKGRSGK